MAIHLFSSHAANGTICLRPLPNEHGKHLAIGVTAKTFMTYMTAACLAITTLSAFVLKSQHLLRYTRPKEQRQIIRIVFMPAWFCLVSLLSMLSYEYSIYFRPITDVYEAWCIPALFLLYLEYVCPDEGARAKYFANLPVGEKKGQKLPPDTGAKWIKSFWIQVFQLPLTQLLSSGAEIATQAGHVYCSNSLKPRYAHIWLTIVNSVIVGAAVTSIIRLFAWTKKEMDPKHKPLAKLITFKGIVFFQFISGILFGFLNGKLIKPTATLTYDDIYYGIPYTVTAFVSLVFSLTFHFAYPSHVYSHPSPSAYHEARRMNPCAAYLNAANPADIYRGIVAAFKLALSKNPPGSTSYSTSSSSEKSRLDYDDYASKPPPRIRQNGRDIDDAAALEPLRVQPERASYPEPYSYPQPTATAYHQPPEYQHGPAYQQDSSEQQLMRGYEGYAGRGYARVDDGAGGRSREASPSRAGPAVVARDIV